MERHTPPKAGCGAIKICLLVFIKQEGGAGAELDSGGSGSGKRGMEII